MAKHKKKRAAKAERKTAAKRKPPRQQQHHHQLNPEADSPSEHPTLLVRFYSLPSELRDEIFAWLLVRPVQWDVKHQDDCLRRRYPTEDTRPKIHGFTHACASWNWSALEWRCDTRPIYVCPWRSQWAPERLNPYLCSLCYDEHHREKPHPRRDPGLQCLCSRRDNLQTLLVCRRWYEEAGRVFYTRNRFAFMSSLQLVEFLTALSPKWRPYVTKISMMCFAWDDEKLATQTAAEDLEHIKIPTDDKEGLLKAWRLLQQLPALSELELDAVMLTSPAAVKVFRQPALKNLRRMHFAQAVPRTTKELQAVQRNKEVIQEFVWPRHASRKAVDDSDFARDMARAIKGMRYGWVRNTSHRDNKTAAGVERQRYLTRFGDDIEEQESEDDD